MKEWKKPQLSELELSETLSPAGDKTCDYKGNVRNCPNFINKNEKEIDLSGDISTYNLCLYSWGNDCLLKGQLS